MAVNKNTHPDGSPARFLVERYLNAAGAAGLDASVADVARVCAAQDSDASRPAVRYLHALYLPAEDICFCVFEAASIDAVRAVNDAGHFPIDRITDVVLLNTRTPATPPTPRRLP